MMDHTLTCLASITAATSSPSAISLITLAASSPHLLHSTISATVRELPSTPAHTHNSLGRSPLDIPTSDFDIEGRRALYKDIFARLTSYSVSVNELQVMIHAVGTPQTAELI